VIERERGSERLCLRLCACQKERCSLSFCVSERESKGERLSLRDVIFVFLGDGVCECLRETGCVCVCE
jgi:hypothetical protein